MNEILNLNDAHNVMFKRYENILENSINVSFSIEEVKEELLKLCKIAQKEDMPLDKKARWLGYVQGILIFTSCINKNEERDFSRPLFTKFYEEKYQKSIDIKNY